MYRRCFLDFGRGVFTALLFFTITAVENGCARLNTGQALKARTFACLRKERRRRKRKIIEYFERIHEKAAGAARDRLLRAAFTPAARTTRGLKYEIEALLDQHYAKQYSAFYDMLFVDSTGFVFHSIRKETDYRHNLLEGKLGNTNLAQALRQGRKSDFVEYTFYSPSGEPAAFFITSVNGGWVVLQCAVNRLNALLAAGRKLGRTGEVYLVNKEKLMLSESRFIEDNTILRLKVDTRAVRAAMQREHGCDILDDYRGVRVFSSFEKFELLGATWVLIAEMDENEVLTDFYMKNSSRLTPRVAKLAGRDGAEDCPVHRNDGACRRIDVSELGKACKAEMLVTQGIATCTGLAVLFPGRFAYLAHISPTDDVYVTNPLARLFLGENRSDFVGQLTRRILHYDVLGCELHRLQFVVVAPHAESLEQTVRAIVNAGAGVSNIRFCYRPRAESAQCTAWGDGSGARIVWRYDGRETAQCSAHTKSLGELLRQVIEYDS